MQHWQFPGSDAERRQQLLKAKENFEQDFFSQRWRTIEPLQAPALFARGVPQDVSNIVGLGIGEKLSDGRRTGLVGIRVYVMHKVSLDTLPQENRIPEVSEGFLTDVVAVGRPVLRQNTAYIRPIRSGTSVGNRNEMSAGTLGCVVTDGDGRRLLLSNNHVLARQNSASLGEVIVQPGQPDGGSEIVATLVKKADVVADGSTPNRIDAAVAEPVAPELLSEDIIGIGKPRGVIDPQPYRWVVKSGRTTGLTRGYIDDVDVTLQVPFAGGIATFTDQILIWGVPYGGYSELPTAQHLPGFSEGGDSGSAIIDEGTNHVAGLLFAGSQTMNISWANKIREVEAGLDVRVAW